ncbi:calcium-binding protein [Maliponia aquimaris]|uniref:Hemolysin, chromosomal n=1 Tax=Maliponia aquimaris TaxID=1673631 RepID=A0A238KTW8_9RHOB|nr:calcium-binding protein [Maliponia aquimaris]SMX45602.1 Hemolysin, chromosomal [Maliponia aquimaris]
MAINFITGSGTQVNVANGDTTFLLPGQIIASITDGVELQTGFNSTDFHNHGTVIGQINGVDVFAGSSAVVNHGTIESLGDGINLNHQAGSGTHRIYNNGDIIAEQEVIDVDSSFTYSLVVVNNGLMLSRNSALISSFGSALNVTVQNTGVMQGQNLNLDASVNAILSNSGTIQTTAIFAISASTVRINNSGQILDTDGAGSGVVIRTSINADVLVNSGLIVGNVELESGADLFQSAASGVVQGVVLGGAGNDTLAGGDSADTLSGDGNDDLILGRGGDDSLDGGFGNDLMLGGAGNDSITGGDDNDTMNGQDGDDTLFGDGGNDAMTGGAGADEMRGGADNDTMNGQDGEDVLEGESGDDILRGGNGDDALAGGLGFDLLTGGQGADSFVFRALTETVAGASRDQIMDFQQGVDIIVVAGLSPGVFEFRGTAGFAPSGNPELRLFETATGSTIVQFDADGNGSVDAEIRVANVTGLTAEDFVL